MAPLNQQFSRDAAVLAHPILQTSDDYGLISPHPLEACRAPRAQRPPAISYAAIGSRLLAK